MTKDNLQMTINNQGIHQQGDIIKMMSKKNKKKTKKAEMVKQRESDYAKIKFEVLSLLV